MELRPIPGYEDLYSISKNGDVYSHKTSRFLKPDKGRYLRVTLSDDKLKRRFFVHRLVLTTFIGHAPDRYVTNHKNGKTHDNRLENLEWCTQGENLKHSFDRLGRTWTPPYKTGESHNQAKLSNDDVYKIRRLGAQGHTATSLAPLFNVSLSTICRVLKRERWRHI